ncbi:MAG: UDP-N-acetylmuramoyl-L-alanine--D-glutamate ligase [Betaproteobacteria bacterium]|nr:UDP-N-acetylmuramoyl-L-alanine--D-glutamate ligase [Betaproteobacteria bacterium]
MNLPHFAQLARPAPRALSGARALVLGLGATGFSAAKWLTREHARPIVADTRRSPPQAAQLAAALPDVPLRAGPFEPSLLDGVDLLCISPGLPLAQPLITQAIARGIPVVGDIELFAWHVRARSSCRVLAVTGTNGKTTVTALTGHLLRTAGIDCEVAGNIGPAALDALALRLDAGKMPEVWVLELSSYQLETAWALEPDAATMLNLSEDHLDRYAGLAEYGAAKARIFIGDGLQVLNRDDARSMAMSLPGRRRMSFGLDVPSEDEDLGARVVGTTRWLAQGRTPILDAAELNIHGEHNLANALAAAALARAVGVSHAAIAAGLKSFAGLPHRVEHVAVYRGVDYFDDSKGTNVGATIAALQGLRRQIVLIAGGDGKGQDFAPLADPVARYARRVLLIGRDAPLIGRALAGCAVPVERLGSLEEAVRRAADCACEGDAVLLSPACASFDMFRDYKHRGDVFAAAARGLGG